MSAKETAKKPDHSLDDEVARMESEETKAGDQPAQETTSQPNGDIALPARKRWLTRKRLIVLAVIGLLVAIVLAVPFLRYGAFGMFVKKTVELKIVDAQSNRPVSGVKVALGRQDGESDAEGVVRITDVAVGDYTAKFEKSHYETKETSVRVPLIMKPEDTPYTLEATGRVVEITVKNRFTGALVSGAEVTAAEANAISDDAGLATLVVDPGHETAEVNVVAEGYNELKVAISLKDSEQFAVDVVPAGKVAFMTKRSGKIDVMTSNLDGSGQEMLLEGTGKESDNSTALVPSPDWKYAAFMSERDGTAKLYLLSLSDKKVTVIDDKYPQHQIAGWVKDRVYYLAQNHYTPNWEPKTNAIVMYHAGSGTRTVIDESLASGTNNFDFVNQSFSPARIVDGRVLYAKTWRYGMWVTDQSRPATIVSVTDASKRTLREVQASPGWSVEFVTDQPNTALFHVTTPEDTSEFYQYKDGAITPKGSLSWAQLMNNNRTFVTSPNGQRVMWSEQRDGKNVSFMSNTPFTEQKEFANGEYRIHSWMTDNYVLYSKNNSELYITNVGGVLDGAHKITDYHSPMRSPYY